MGRTLEHRPGRRSLWRLWRLIAALREQAQRLRRERDALAQRLAHLERKVHP